MNTRRCLKIATRMNTLLQRELGRGIDAARTVADAHYARDVLLVCDAFREGELPQLSQQFRQAASTPEKAAPPPRRPGFSASRFLTSIFGLQPAEDSGHAPLTPPPPAAAGSGEYRPRSTGGK